jgi:hypothetical protein
MDERSKALKRIAKVKNEFFIDNKMTYINKNQQFGYYSFAPEPNYPDGKYISYAYGGSGIK